MNILIVGAGLAGCCLGHQLEEKGANVTLIDEGINHSSKIAAGMINPMVFRRMLLSWKATELIPYLTEFYKKLEKKTGESFFHKRIIKRVFSSEQEASLWNERINDPEYTDVLLKKVTAEDEPDYVISRFGGGYVDSPGYIDSENFISANHNYFLAHKKLIIEAFDFNKLDVKSSSYNGKPYDHIIFCEGYRGKENPYFNYLPLNQTKGEVLTISATGLPTNEILNRKCFVLPTEKGTYKVGATFTWNTTDLSLTDEAREELLTHFSNLTPIKPAIIAHEAGVRPTVSDRRPLIGRHPTHDKLFIFNGLGTKGYMLAPYFSKELACHIADNKELTSEVNIKRFEKKWFKAKQ